MSNALHVPIRMCAVTREKLPKRELLRFVWVKESKQVVLDQGERVRGRGLNMKPDLEVFDKAIKIKLFERSFKITFSPEELAKLRSQVDDYIGAKFREKKVVRISNEQLANLKKSK